MVIGPTRQSSVAIDRIISDIAERNDGLVPTARLVTRVNRKVVTNRIDAGVLIPLAPGICILRGTPITPLRRALAVSILRPDAWASHTTAALRWKATIDDRIVHAEVSVVRPQSVRIPGVRSHRTSTRPSDRRIVRWAGGHVSGPEQCIAELADVLDVRRLELAMDSLIHARVASPSRLAQLLDGQSPNRRGRRELRQLVDDRLHGGGIIRSWLEQDALRVLARAGLRRRSAITGSGCRTARAGCSISPGRSCASPSRPTAGSTTHRRATGGRRGSGTVSSRPRGGSWSRAW